MNTGLLQYGASRSWKQDYADFCTESISLKTTANEIILGTYLRPVRRVREITGIARFDTA